jgi:hypothetical protein
LIYQQVVVYTFFGVVGVCRLFDRLNSLSCLWPHSHRASTWDLAAVK